MRMPFRSPRTVRGHCCTEETITTGAGRSASRSIETGHRYHRESEEWVQRHVSYHAYPPRGHARLTDGLAGYVELQNEGHVCGGRDGARESSWAAVEVGGSADKKSLLAKWAERSKWSRPR